MPVLPIVTYNDPVLRQKTSPVQENSEELQALIESMFQTMYHASGVGLAAPQIGSLLRAFVIDADSITSKEEDIEFGPLAFINPEIIEHKGPKVKMEEGCLSIPEVRDDVTRPQSVIINYLDREFNRQQLELSGWLSRVVQHEYDHLNGVLFLDHLSSFRRRLHRSVLRDIEQGMVETEYPVVSKNNEELKI
ncbi:MAG: peptide deformylase [Balneolaceae bacterium]